MERFQDSPAAERNKDPILEVLRTEFSDARDVLEIGSGTGQHAVFFGARLPHLTWHTSDLSANLDAIGARLACDAPANVMPPFELDVERSPVPALSIGAVFSANTAHIMSIRAVQHMFGLVGRLLPTGGSFCLYGPFNFDGQFSSESNARFDASLRKRKATMGIRDLGDLDALGMSAGMVRLRLYAMPAMNYLAVWQKLDGERQD